jgi:hypothetical protein
MNYKLWIEGEAKGPCTLEDLRVMLEEGDIDGQTLYAEEGTEEYKPLSGLSGVLNVVIPASSPAPVPESAPAETTPVPNADQKIQPAYHTPIPVLVVYALGAFALILGIFLLMDRDATSNYLDRDIHPGLIRAGVAALFMGYLYDLIAQCLFELKEANRLRRKE